MKPQVILACGLAVVVPVVERKDPADLPHDHQESHAPDGPNMRSVSFGTNGTITSSPTVTTVRVDGPVEFVGFNRKASW
jgi:hypothetical protein